jgi:hypothetical protein
MKQWIGSPQPYMATGNIVHPSVIAWRGQAQLWRVWASADAWMPTRALDLQPIDSAAIIGEAKLAVPCLYVSKLSILWRP